MSLSSYIASACVALGVVAVSARCVHAQDRAQDNTPITSSISINPFAIILGGANAEGEFTLSPDISLGVAGTYFPSSASGFDKGEHYGTFDVKLRFYPQERTPRGFAVAVTGGMVNYRFSDDDDVTSGATLGFEADYNWLLGHRQRFLVGTGLGVRRVLGKGDDIIPAFRFQLGYAFHALRTANR